MHIYLDHNATTPVLPEVADAVHETTLRYHANPGSQHEPGRQARRALETARRRVGELLGARTQGQQIDQVLFTSGGTEATNLAITGLTNPRISSSASPLEGKENRSPDQSHFLTTAIEHPCVLETCKHLHDHDVEIIPPNTQGQITPNQVRESLRPNTRLVSVMLANNETGVLQPIAEIAEICASQNIALHSDVAQAVGKMPVNFAELNLAAMSLAAHKFQGPLGIGALIVRHDIDLTPSLFGGHQQAGLRPGTESVALAVGMQTALECWHRDAEQTIQRVTQLRDRFEQLLTAELPEILVIGREVPRLPNTSNLSFVGHNRQAMLMALDQEGIACSTGSACASGSSELSPVLLAMGLERSVVEGSIRFSLGNSTTVAEIDEAVHRILSLCKRLR